MQTTTTTTTEEVSQVESPDLFSILAEAIWNALNVMTGMVGLTVVQVLMIASVLAGALMTWHLIRAMLKKQTWTLDPADTPAQYIILPESANLHSTEESE